MVDITLRNIPLKLQEALRKRADTEGRSLDETVLRILEEAAGQPAAGRHPHDDLDHLAGTWSEEEAAAFEAALAEQRPG